MVAAQYIGGPLDGQTVESRGSWPLYRDDQGLPMAAHRGNRIFCGVNKKPTTGYSRQHGDDGRVFYLHATHSSRLANRMDAPPE